MKQLRPMRNEKKDRGYTNVRLRTVRVLNRPESGLSLTEIKDELDGYWDVLLGRKDSPVTGMHALQEVADQYYARASEITAMIQRFEEDGTIEKGSALVKFRTGELRTFREVARAAADLGSRRLTALQVESEQSRLGRESAG